MAKYPWVEVVDFGIVLDSRTALVEAFGEASRSCDVLVTTGGVSAGEEDYVVSALNHHGGALDVMKVAMRPGRPVKIGLIGECSLLGCRAIRPQLWLPCARLRYLQFGKPQDCRM